MTETAEKPAPKSRAVKTPADLERENESLKQQLADNGSASEYTVTPEGEGRYAVTRTKPNPKHAHDFLVTITAGPKAGSVKQCIVQGCCDESEAARAVFLHVLHTSPSKHLFKVESF